ncbi:MAG: hypothetical protein ACFFE6_13590 [Candidatus Thorarchaeota archaeon]
MVATFDINELAETLISFAYPELEKKEVVVSWGETSVFGHVRWGHEDQRISVRINKRIRDWHQAGITGLLSHELSHPAQSGSGLRERETDQDVISRGLGAYLAVERLLAGKYDDHIIGRGKDRYLGYQSIRNQLTSSELQNLDMLMAKMQLKPTSTAKNTLLSHDSILFREKSGTIMAIEGIQFEIPVGLQNPDIKLVSKEGVVLVYADEVLIGQYQDDTYI